MATCFTFIQNAAMNGARVRNKAMTQFHQYGAREHATFRTLKSTGIAITAVGDGITITPVSVKLNPDQQNCAGLRSNWHYMTSSLSCHINFTALALTSS